MEPETPAPPSTLNQDPSMSFLPRTLASTSTLRAARSISSTSVPSIVNRLPEPHPNTEHPPRTNEGLRVCQVISVKPERLEEYEQVHREVWPGVLNALRRANVVGEQNTCFIQRTPCLCPLMYDNRLLDPSYGSPSRTCFFDDDTWTIGRNTPLDRSYEVHGETRGFRPGYEQGRGRSRDSEMVEGELSDLLRLVIKQRADGSRLYAALLNS
jgi:hypothetical protein